MRATEFDWAPLESISKEPEKAGFYRLTRDNYWVVDDTDHIPVFRKYSMQCNANKEIVEDLVAKGLYGEAKVRVVFLEKAWIPIEPRDYSTRLKTRARK